MEQTHLLWIYQQADMDADRMEKDIRRNPKRLTLKKNRNFLIEQQNLVKRMEEEVSDMMDRMEIIKIAIARIEEQLAALLARMEATPPEDLQTARGMNQDVQKLLKDLGSYEQEMQRMEQEAALRDKQEKEIRQKYAKVKTEYDRLKVEYEAEHKEELKALDEKRLIAKTKTEGITEEMMARYHSIKQHISPPMATLFGDQCGGCNMNLPQVTLRNIKVGKIIECETCGRMIIQMEQ